MLPKITSKGMKKKLWRLLVVLVVVMVVMVLVLVIGTTDGEY